MQFHFDISSNQPQQEANPAQAQPPAPMQPLGERLIGILHEMLELQRSQFQHMVHLLNEHLNHAKAVQSENMSRWRHIMGRWEAEFPQLAEQCKKVYPVMERAYIRMIHNMVEELAADGDEAFESEFSLMEYIDRHGMRLGQFGHLLGVVGPISETAANKEQS